MHYANMRPHQISDAIARNVPVVLPIGVMENHGEHLPAGVDLLIVTEILARLDTETIVLPAFAYGAASHAVAAAGSGTLHIATEAFEPLGENLFSALLATGFRNIHGVIHHQTENFAQGMPTDLAFRLAARNAIFKHVEKNLGPGWWGSRAMKNYYAEQGHGSDPFNWVQIHPLFPKGSDFPFDHAGLGETSLMLALAPETVDLARVADGDHWFSETAATATVALGESGVSIALAHLRIALAAKA